MNHSTTVAQIHKSPPARVHKSGRRHRSQSRHEKHKCHKHRQRLLEESLQAEVTKLRNENYFLNKRLTASTTSLDSGLPNTENLPPIDLDLKQAYTLIKNENNNLLEQAKNSRLELENLGKIAHHHETENSTLRQDVFMLKNLVYRLNVELEKLQEIRDSIPKDNPIAQKKYVLPKYYNKNFLKPLLPLLRAYTEVIDEKKETISQLESSFERFNVSFNELLRENETLYKELEMKKVQGDDSVYDEVKILRKEVDILREEKEIYLSQIRIDAEKLKEVHILYKAKVTLLGKEKEDLLEKLQDVKGELCNLKGKQTVFKQELDRLRSEDESKVPIVVHSAALGECKRLLQNLKNDYEAEKQSLSHKLKELETKLRMKDEEVRKDNEERLNLEQGNFDLTFENDVLKRRIADFESREVPAFASPPEKERHVKDELQTTKKQMRDAKKKVTELENKLQKTKKQLQQAMAFAEDIVREQEGLLAQLHEKQRENSAMVSQFGSLKNKLKLAEKGAKEGLDSVEKQVKEQEAANQELVDEVERLSLLLKEKDEPSHAQPSTDGSIS